MSDERPMSRSDFVEEIVEAAGGSEMCRTLPDEWRRKEALIIEILERFRSDVLGEIVRRARQQAAEATARERQCGQIDSIYYRGKRHAYAELADSLDAAGRGDQIDERNPHVGVCSACRCGPVMVWKMARVWLCAWCVRTRGEGAQGHG